MTQTDTVQHLMSDALQELPEGERELLFAEIGEILYTNVMRRVHGTLSLLQQDVLQRLLEESANMPEDANGHKALATFIQQQVPTFEEFVREEWEALVTRQQQALSALE